jgi:hypothetical protein
MNINMNKRVAVPTSESQAAAMVILGMDWLKRNAPHRLTLKGWDSITSLVTRDLDEDASKPQGTFAGSNDRVPDTFIEPVTEYYYRTNDCTAEDPSHVDCTCWHKVGSGPMPDVTPKNDNYVWRTRQVDQRQQPKPEPANIRERWNIERDGDALLVCFNDHEKGESCQYVRYVRESDQKPDLISLALNQAIKDGTVMVKVIPNEEVFVNPQTEPAHNRTHERVVYMRRDFDLSTFQRSRYWAEECRMIVEALFTETAPKIAAVRTLEGMRYTYHGGEQWKPPLGERPAWLDEKQASAEDFELVSLAIKEHAARYPGCETEHAWQRIETDMKRLLGVK